MTSARSRLPPGYTANAKNSPTTRAKPIPPTPEALKATMSISETSRTMPVALRAYTDGTAGPVPRSGAGASVELMPHPPDPGAQTGRRQLHLAPPPVAAPTAVRRQPEVTVPSKGRLVNRSMTVRRARHPDVGTPSRVGGTRRVGGTSTVHDGSPPGGTVPRVLCARGVRSLLGGRSLG